MSISEIQRLVLPDTGVPVYRLAISESTVQKELRPYSSGEIELSSGQKQFVKVVRHAIQKYEEVIPGLKNRYLVFYYYPIFKQKIYETWNSQLTTGCEKREAQLKEDVFLRDDKMSERLDKYNKGYYYLRSGDGTSVMAVTRETPELPQKVKDAWRDTSAVFFPVFKFTRHIVDGPLDGCINHKLYTYGIEAIPRR
jgi:hypothetical protein